MLLSPVLQMEPERGRGEGHNDSALTSHISMCPAVICADFKTQNKQGPVL